MNLLRDKNPALVGLVVVAMLAGCSDSTEPLASGASSIQETQMPLSHSCEIEHSDLLFVENIKSFSGFDLSFVLPNGCTIKWSGMTEVTLDTRIKFERVSKSNFNWVNPRVRFANLGFTTGSNCRGPEWSGCPPAPGRLSDSAAAAQLESSYGDCLDQLRNPCEVEIHFAATDYLAQSQPIYLWVAINRIKVPGTDLKYRKWDPSQLGGSLTVVGTLNLIQVQP